MLPKADPICEYSEEFHNAQIRGNISFDSPEYVKLMQATSDYLMRFKPKTSLEIGPGVGVLLYQMNKAGCNSYGIDANIYSQLYYQLNSNGFEHKYLLNGCFTLEIENSVLREPDLLVSIECFEHLTDSQIKWYMDRVEAPYFYFSSIPEKCTPFERDGKMWDDESWGHIHIMKTEEWIEYFKQWGYEVMDRPKIVTIWDVMFKKMQ